MSTRVTDLPSQGKIPRRTGFDISFLLKVARPGFWTTSIWFYLLPVGRRHVFGEASFWFGMFYVTLPLGLLLYGSNDLVDGETDRLNPRKGTFLFGARGTAAELAGLPMRITLIQLPFLFAFGALFGVWKSLGWFASVFLATLIYNWPRVGTKGRPVFDLLTQSAYVLVFVLSSWVAHVPQLPWFTFLFGALFAMHSHLFGEIMDMDPDRLAGRRTTATAIGVVPAKFLMAGLLASESMLVFFCARDSLTAAFLAASTLWFILDATVLWRDHLYTAGQMRFFFIGWNVAAVVSMPIVWRMGSLAWRG